jgi:hypothetical protein
MSAWLEANHELIVLAMSGIALLLSVRSSVLASRAENRARESVRPFISTGVHATEDDMCVTLTNYGVGVAIIHSIFMHRNGDRCQNQNSLVPLLPTSDNYELQSGIFFVQEFYYLRPGDQLRVVSAVVKSGREPAAALGDWAGALNGIQIDVRYRDILEREFHYVRHLGVGAH